MINSKNQLTFLLKVGKCAEKGIIAMDMKTQGEETKKAGLYLVS